LRGEKFKKLTHGQIRRGSQNQRDPSLKVRVGGEGDGHSSTELGVLKTATTQRFWSARDARTRKEGSARKRGEKIPQSVRWEHFRVGPLSFKGGKRQHRKQTLEVRLEKVFAWGRHKETK